MALLIEPWTTKPNTANQTSMKNKLANQIKQLQSTITWMENGTMLRTQKQRFYKLMGDGRIVDAYALIDEYRLNNQETQLSRTYEQEPLKKGLDT
jgi:hypothetical protein